MADDEVPDLRAVTRGDSYPGLSSAEAAALLQRWGANTVAEQRETLLRRVVASLWQPVPWLLEATIVLELVMGQYLEALIIALLLAFNSILTVVQEHRSGKALDLLKQRLAPSASVRRDARWTQVPAAGLVPGDIVRLALGGIVPADVVLIDGAVLLDQSVLTGESVAVDAHAGDKGYAGALVRRGEALARVTATGARTYFGKTAELVRIAHAQSSEQKAVLRVVRNITAINGVILAAISGYAHLLGLPTGSLLQLIVTAVLASIPVALPATFSLAAALAAQVLARRGVLLTHLEGVHEAASVDTLCADKTGTLTRNELAVVSVLGTSQTDRAEVLRLAAVASSEGGGDPVDDAVRAAAVREGAVDRRYERTSFTPFDPALKRSSATVVVPGRTAMIVMKGAFDSLASASATPQSLREEAEKLERDGQRVLAVVCAPAGQPAAVVGLVGLADPPREDSAPLIRELAGLGVRTIMVTGDAPATARAIAGEVGLSGPLLTGEGVRDGLTPTSVAVVAGVLPEHKYRLVQAFQRQGHVVGMCGDGANDAPALRQAQFGVAVSTATDIAKSAASVVLTEPGLRGIVEVIGEGRRVHQRVVTYALNAITKKIELVPLLALGLIVTGQPILTPLLMILLLVAGDFLTMALTTDRAQPSPRPAAWHLDRLTRTAIVLGVVTLAFTAASIAVGKEVLGYPTGTLQTLTYVTVAFVSQAVLYAVRVPGWLWESSPSPWLLLATLVDVGFAAALAVTGTLMSPLPAGVVLALALATALFALVLTAVKLVLFRTQGRGDG